MPTGKTEVWERQEGESPQAFEAFRTYRDMGEKRTLSAVARELGKSLQLIERWKKAWSWKDRALAYDHALDREAHKEAVKSLREMTKRHIKISVQIQSKALEALQRMNVEDMTPKDVREYIKMATELERLNRMYAASDAEMDTEGGTKIDIYMPQKEDESYE